MVIMTSESTRVRSEAIASEYIELCCASRIVDLFGFDYLLMFAYFWKRSVRQH